MLAKDCFSEISVEVCLCKHLVVAFVHCISVSGIKYRLSLGGGAHSTMDSLLASHPVAPGLILNIPKKYYLDVAEIY